MLQESLMHFRYGTYSTSEAVNAGLDLEMPGPSRWRGAILGHALKSNKLSEFTLDNRARQMLKLVDRCSRSGVPENAKEGTLNTPKTAALLRKLAGESLVLMKNDKSVLPLKKDKSVRLMILYL